MSYKPILKPNQLILGNGDTVIVSGWYIKEKLASHLNAEDYAAIGNLFSRSTGISILLKNLLANPQVRHIAILNATKADANSGSSKALYSFFEHGYQCCDRGYQIAGHDAHIDADIAKEHLNLLRQDCVVEIFDTVSDLVNHVKTRKHMSENRPRYIYQPKKIQRTALPQSLYGHLVREETIADTWLSILYRIRTGGTIRPTGYDDSWQEVVDLVAVVENEPEDFFIPEHLPVSQDFLKEYIPQVVYDSPVIVGTKYTYGQRMRSHFGVDQVEQVIAKLVNEIDAASAVINLWDTQDHVRGGSPCLNHLWFRVNSDRLSLTATFRSNDMYSAWCANAFALRALQMHVQNELSLRLERPIALAPLITLSQSAHIYSDAFEDADRLIQAYYSKKRVSYTDPVGSFVISTLNNAIAVEQLDHSGTLVATYTGDRPLHLLREITRLNPSIEPSHAGYLGMELERAKNAIRLGIEYVQDR